MTSVSSAGCRYCTRYVCARLHMRAFPHTSSVRLQRAPPVSTTIALRVQTDAPQDALLSSTTRLHVDLRAALPADQPEPEAAFSRQDEKPQVVQALEAAAFQGRMEEDEGMSPPRIVKLGV